MVDITSYIEIMNLIYSYPDRIDAGDFAGVGELFADAVIDMDDGQTLSGRADIQAYFERWTRRYDDDGTPHTRHCINNPIVDIDEERDEAVVRYYITVFQRTEEFPLQPVWSNKYEDRLRRADGRWRFARRRGYSHLPGDVSHHLLDTPPQVT
jgi:ketosteroid isomerase-like protein